MVACADVTPPPFASFLEEHRRAVYRFVLSPERAEGLDLRQLTGAAMTRLEAEAKTSGLRWIAAEHRNTAHPHVHIVLAGMREDGAGGYRGLLITKGRLAAMKEELGLEILRQRGRDGRPHLKSPADAGGTGFSRRPPSSRPAAHAILFGCRETARGADHPCDKRG